MLTAFSFAPWDLWFLSLFSFFPIFFLIESDRWQDKPVKNAIFWGLLSGFLMDIFAYYWVIHTMTVFGHLSYPFALFVFFLYAVITNTRYVIFFALAVFWKSYLKKNTIKHKFLANPFLYLTVFWGISETFGWQLFPWYGGNLMNGNIVFIQTVDIGGIYLTSLFWFFISYSLYKISLLVYENYNNKKNIIKKIFLDKNLTAGIILLIITHLYGAGALLYWSNKEKSYDVKNIAVIQGSTPLGFQNIRNLAAELRKIIDGMVNQTLEVAAEASSKNINIDFLVWPESAVPFLRYEKEPFLREKIRYIQGKIPVEFMLSDIHSMKVNKKTETYNNVWLLSEKGEPIESYQKVFLLPFGEFMPLGDIFPALADAFPEVSNFDRGSRFPLLPSKIGNILPLICYEVIPPDFTWSFYKKTESKANIIINLTNDAWFGKSIASYQHMALGIMRAIELRIPIVRSTNAGVTAYIDTLGNIHEPTGLFTRENRLYQVKIPQKNTTLFSIWGSIPYYLFLFIFFALGLFNIWQKPKTKK
ncbi:MAG: apolipoprotein N-acyltransferase [Spirochaetia bacterium]|nr:apolipoprotein N-acyltransferase [Spirochaetia bacterium]